MLDYNDLVVFDKSVARDCLVRDRLDGLCANHGLNSEDLFDDSVLELYDFVPDEEIEELIKLYIEENADYDLMEYDEF